MRCPGRKSLPFLLIFVPVSLHGALSQEASPAGQRKPFFECLRRLEEQFRRSQEATLAHLRLVASNHSPSLDIEARFQSLAQENQAMALALSRSQAVVQGDLGHLKTWMRKMQRRSRKLDRRLLALDAALGEGSTRREREQEAQRGALASLALDVQALRDALARLMPLVQSQGARLAALEGQLQVAAPGVTAAQPRPSSPSSPQLQGGRQALGAPPAPGDARLDSTRRLQGTLEPPGGVPPPREPRRDLQPGPRAPLPERSTANAVFLHPGFLTGLRALSVCSWVPTASGHLVTLLSYATEENDNKLVLHGRDSLVPGSMHFVIGDPDFRELPLQPLLDGRWHHVCVIWTSALDRYWVHVDRRLVATSSRFREGYKIPPLVLGQEQDSVGGGFDSSEAFVGSMAGLAIWDRVLVPGEVSNLATGKELLMGAILMLANAALVGGFVQRLSCTCLPLCPEGLNPSCCAPTVGTALQRVPTQTEGQAAASDHGCPLTWDVGIPQGRARTHRQSRAPGTPGPHPFHRAASLLPALCWDGISTWPTPPCGSAGLQLSFSPGHGFGT